MLFFMYSTQGFGFVIAARWPAFIRRFGDFGGVMI